MASVIVVQTEPTVNSNTGEFTAPDIKNDTLSCNICQEDISDNNIKTPCNHAFCGDCFFKWMQEKPNCPMCRKEFVNEDIMKNISDNREELSILTSELEYTRYQAVRIKRRLCKRKRTCTELLKRQISLKQMLEETKMYILLERKKLKTLRIKRTPNHKERQQYYKEDIKFINEIMTTSSLFGNINDATENLSGTSEDVTLSDDTTSSDIPYIPLARDALDETIWNNTLLNEETVSPTPTQTHTPEYSPYDSETNSSPSTPNSSPEPTETPPEVPSIATTNIEQIPISQEFNSPFEFGMEAINFEELFPVNRDNSSNVIFEFGQSN
jgi:hypothetical protein